jgi:hypothetical protein
MATDLLYGGMPLLDIVDRGLLGTTAPAVVRSENRILLE